MSSKQLVTYNLRIIQDAKEGDLLEFPRGWYSHWEDYIGNEEVVHLAGVENDGLNANVNSGHLFTISGKRFKKAKVKREHFWNVVQNSEVKINNTKDDKCRPRPKTDIVREALKKIGDIGYNVLWHNCEHFAAYCRYGKAWSEQANAVVRGVMVAGAIVVVHGILYEMFRGGGRRGKEGKS